MSHKPTDLYRRNVGIAVFNDRGLVLIAQRADRPGAWQMPQGGLDGDEDPWQGALRELEEEIGTAKVTYLGETEVWLRYEFPAQDRARTFKGNFVGQEQKWFAVRFTGVDQDIDLAATDHAEFSAWRWATLEEAVSLIVDFKRPIYEEIAHHFAKFGVSHE